MESDESIFLIGIVVWMLLFGLIGMSVWRNKGGSPGGGFILGALLGIIGVIILALIKPGEKEIQKVGGLVKCPNCAELVKKEAKVCKHCGRDVVPA